MVEFIDESIREGDARGFHPQSAETRMALLRLTQEVCGIDEFSLGWAAISDVDRETLLAFLGARAAGELRASSRALVFEVFQLERPFSALMNGFTSRDRAALVLGFGVAASDEIAPHLDGPWLLDHDGVLPATTEALHERLATLAAERLQKLKALGAQQVGLIVQDAFRASLEALLAYVDRATNVGVDFVRLNDSVGTATPLQVRARLAALFERFPRQRFVGHFHNDLGMAVANAVTATETGIHALDVTVNGVGNRAGNPSVAELAMALRIGLGSPQQGVVYARLNELTRAAEKHFCLPLSPYAPVVGKLVYADEASVRTHIIETVGPTTWLPYEPALVGGRMAAVHTQTSGRQTVAQTLARRRKVLAAAGVGVDDALVTRAFQWVQREIVDRAGRYRAVAWQAAEDYASAIQRSYVTDEDIVENAIKTHGTFIPEAE